MTKKKKPIEFKIPSQDDAPNYERDEVIFTAPITATYTFYNGQVYIKCLDGRTHHRLDERTSICKDCLLDASQILKPKKEKKKKK
jgi:hypothetical protein